MRSGRGCCSGGADGESKRLCQPVFNYLNPYKQTFNFSILDLGLTHVLRAAVKLRNP